MTLLRFGEDTPAKWWVGDDEVAIAWHGEDEIWRAAGPPEGTMYLIGSTNEHLYTLDRDTSVATRVGNVDGFGVSENSVGALGSDDTSLYIASHSISGGFLTVDPDTGVATRVGNAFRFGVNELEVRGFAWDGTNFYMLGGTNDALYTLDRSTGVATRVGSANQFGVGVGNPLGLAWDGTDLYMLGSPRFRVVGLYTLDRTTGVATLVRNLPLEFNSPPAATGLTWDGATLYMTDGTSLYTLDRTTASWSRVMATSGFGIGERIATYIAWVPVPTVSTPIPNMSPAVYAQFSFNLSTYFTGANSYAAESSDTTVAAVRITGAGQNFLFVNPRSAGSAVITVTATNAGGSVQQTFTVTFPVLPSSSRNLPDASAEAGAAASTIDLSTYFSDATEYSATSATPAVATVSVSGSTLTVTPVQAGSSVITVTARNPAGFVQQPTKHTPVSYTHLRAHETPEHLVCRLLLEKKKK